MSRAKMSNKLFFPAVSVKPFLQQFTQTEVVYLHAGAHPAGLFGSHDRSLVPQLLSIKADKISNTVTAGL